MRKSDSITDCENCPIRKRRIFRQLGQKDLEYVSKFKSGELKMEAGAIVLAEEHKSPHLYTILEGWAFRHKATANGKRQILNFALPGDLVGLQLSILNEMQHSVTALTPLKLCVFERTEVWDMFKVSPALGFSLTWQAAREEQMLDGHLLNVGQRSAEARVAYLILHLYDRADGVGLAGNNALDAPFTQQHFADALGITYVHANRTLRKLVKRGLLTWQDKTILIRDREALAEISQYEQDEEGSRLIL
jgi:CRP/FNR family transcriptional regulator